MIKFLDLLNEEIFKKSEIAAEAVDADMKDPEPVAPVDKLAVIKDFAALVSTIASDTTDVESAFASMLSAASEFVRTADITK